MPPLSDNFSPVSRSQIIESYIKALRLIDERVTPLLGKATTQVLVQVAAKRVTNDYPFLHFFTTMTYTHVDTPVIYEQFSGTDIKELSAGLDAFLEACFSGLTELTGNIITVPLHHDIVQQLQQLQ